MIKQAANGEELAVAAGQEVCVVNYFDSATGVSDFDYTMKVEEDEYCESAMRDLQISESGVGDNVIV